MILEKPSRQYRFGVKLLSKTVFENLFHASIFLQYKRPCLYSELYMSKHYFDCNNFYEATKRYIGNTESEISDKNAEILDQKRMPGRALLSWNPGEFLDFKSYLENKFNLIS